MTGLTSGSATRLVDRLEKTGYVTRQRDEQDRRRVLAKPVPAAMQRLREFWDSLAEAWQAMFDGWPASELVTSPAPAPLGPPSRRPQRPAHGVEVSPALGVCRGRPPRSPVHLEPKELTPRKRHCTLGFPRCSDPALHGDWPF
ncbi:MarR family transcriptional regulator [Streptomyces mirabilis]|uniref:MarR family transcriptional regulator n=1 Tax=Streptomyces mirabilis TaxID=68239 RepID=UPI0037199610